MYKMSVFSITFLCILFAHQSIGLSHHLFVCSPNHRDLFNIELLCTDGAKIDIVNVWKFRSNHTYSCTNNNTATSPEERKYDMRNPRLWHEILTNCVDERQCNFVTTNSLYSFGPDVDLSKLRYAGIEIEYNCLPESKFVHFCNQTSTPIKNENDTNLIFKKASNSGKNFCYCDVFPSGTYFNVTMNLFPTESGYLTEVAYGRETKYSATFFINYSRRFTTGFLIWQTFNVTYDFKKPNKVVPVFIVKYSGDGIIAVSCAEANTTESLEKNPEPPVQETNPVEETNPVVGYAVTATVTTITILGIIACTVIVYYRNEAKKKGTTPYKKGNMPASSKRLSGNSQASVSFDCADSLSNSYAEVGSISDYRHYVMPDDTSLQSFRMKILFEEFEEASHYVSSANLDSKPPEHTATEQTQQDMNNADKTDCENSATAKEEACKFKSKMPGNIKSVHLQNEKMENQMCLVLAETTDKYKLDKNTDLPKNSGAEHKFDRENKTISREHYDTFGYLDLNITEKTSHQYLQKWIKEIYSVEENARKEGENEEIQQVGQRRVLIAENDIADKEPDTFYSYANFLTIEFSDEETPFY